MKTRPFTEAHAIAEVQFILSLTGDVSEEQLHELRGLSELYGDTFTEVETVPNRGAEAALPPQLFFPSDPAIRFRRQEKSTGRVVLSLDIQKHVVRFTMFEYRGWVQSRRIALSVLHPVKSALAEMGLISNSCGLKFVDRFVLESPADYAFTDVFSPNQVFFTPYLASVGAAWHSSNGWFESTRSGQLLENLNVSAQILTQTEHLTTIDHSMQTVPHQVDQLLADNEVETHLDGMHEVNKLILKNSLSVEMSKRIGLVEE